MQMIKERHVMLILYVEMFLCLITHIIYSFFVYDFETTINVSLISAVCFLTPFLLYLSGRLAKYKIDIFNITVIIAATSIGVILRTLAFSPFYYIGTAIVISMMCDTGISIRFAVVSNAVLLLTLFWQYDIINEKIPTAIFLLILTVYNICIWTTVFMARHFKKTIDEINEYTKNNREILSKKNWFLSNISSQMRDPINIIHGLCTVILRETKDIETKKNVVEIRNSGRNLQLMLNDTLDLMRFDSGSLSFNESPYNFAQMLSEVINVTVSRLEHKNIKLIVDVDPDIPAELIGDETRVKKILINLLTNAIFSKECRNITFRISQEKRDYGINLRGEIVDDGLEISKENIPDVFTMFSQIDQQQNLTSNNLDSNISLSITKSLIAMLGGFIKVQTDSDNSNAYCFTIPHRVNNNKSFINIKNREKICVLLFENWQKNKAFYEKIFNDMGVELIYCGSRTDFIVNIENPRITHIITGYNEYLFDKPVFDRVSQQTEVVVLRSPADKRELYPCVRRAYYPLYTITCLEIFDENIKNNYNNLTNQPTIKTSGAKILLVDNSYVNLQLTEKLLKPYEAVVTFAEGGKEAIELLKTKKFDIVFMENYLPDMNGFVVTKMLRNFAGEYYKILPIIALVSDSENSTKDLLLRNGFTDLIIKPVEMNELESILKKWLPADKIYAIDSKSCPISASCENCTSECKKRDVKEHKINKEIDILAKTRENYFAVLRDFCSQARISRVILESAISHPNLKKFSNELRILNSSFKSIGADTLLEQCYQLEKEAELDDFDYVKDNITEFLNEYDYTVKEISNYISENLNNYDSLNRENFDKSNISNALNNHDNAANHDSGDNPTISNEQLWEYIKHIRYYAESVRRDDAELVFEEIQAYQLPENVRKTLDSTRELMNSYNFTAAVQEIEALIAELERKEQD